MPEQSIRFGINDGLGNRSATWKCWSPMRLGKFDVYLACRALGGALKASLHQSGQWHIAYSNAFFEKNLDNLPQNEKGRFIEKWPRPNEIAPGVTLAYRIVTPCSAVNTPYDESKFKNVKWILNAKEGKATEIDVIITDPSILISDWPGKHSMNTKIIGSIKLPNGETVWIVYWEIEMPTIPIKKLTPTYFIGKSKKDLQGDNLHILLFGNEKDGSRVLYDFAIIVK